MTESESIFQAHAWALRSAGALAALTAATVAAAVARRGRPRMGSAELVTQAHQHREP